jgi:hypothetical protein
MFSRKKQPRQLEVFTNKQFYDLYNQLHQEMESVKLALKDFESKVEPLKDLFIDPYNILSLERNKEMAASMINEAFMEIINHLDGFEGLWRADRNTYILGSNAEIEDEWSQRHAKFYDLVMMILLQRAYLAREQLLVKYGHLK